MDATRQTPIAAILGLSADSLVLLERVRGTVIFATSTASIVGWTSHGNSLKLYYDHGSVLVLRCAEGSEEDLSALLRRLEAVSRGCEAAELMLRRNAAGQLGFHVQEEGIIVDVEMYSFAWQAGLRQGSRIVEVTLIINYFCLRKYDRADRFNQGRLIDPRLPPHMH